MREPLSLLSIRIRKLTLCGLLGALAIILSMLESVLPPIPVMPPGAKLGLSNLVTMYAAEMLGLVPTLFLALLKGLFAGVTRGITAFLMSLSGGLSSSLVMWALLRLKNRPFGYVGLGVAGALTHNAAQLLVAALLTTPAVWFYIPWLIIFGILTGTATGMALRILVPALSKIPF